MARISWKWRCAASLAVSLTLGAVSTTAVAQPQRPTYARRSLAEWLGDLADKSSQDSEDKRRRAAYALGQMGPAAQEAVGALIATVKDPHMEPRWYAVDALGRIGGGADVARAIAAALEDRENDVYVRRAAVKSLGRLGKAAAGELELLRGQLGSDDPIIRASAALSWWQIAGDDEALATLRDMLTSQAAGPSFQACMALAEIGPTAAPLAGELVGALEHEDADVRRAAASALGRQGLPAARLIQSELNEPHSEIDRIAAAAALGFIGDDLRRNAFYNNAASSQQFDAALAEVREILLPPLAAMLRLPAAEQRSAGSRSLAKLGSVAVPVLLDGLTSGQPEAQSAAAEALVRLEKYLPNAAQGSAPLASFQQSLTAQLVAALGHEQFEVRYSAVRILAALSLGKEAQAAVPLLNKALEDEDAGIRRYAAQALAEIEGTKG